MSDATLRALEALLFVSDEPVTSVVLAQAPGDRAPEVDALCEQLAAGYEERGAGITLRNVAGGWRLTTHPDAAPVVEQYVLPRATSASPRPRSRRSRSWRTSSRLRATRSRASGA
jgi:chromosome segregation and condensation protein ScpB